MKSQNLFKKLPLHIIFGLLSAAILLGCTQHSGKLPNRTFHNITAHYNAYYLAKEKLKEVEGIIKDNHKDDYNRILDVLYEIDTSKKENYSTEVEYAQEKASAIINGHKNSNWVDDGYTQIGRCLLYNGFYQKAIQTFKYVNTNSKDDAAKQKALAYLLRTYLDAEENTSANTVAEYLLDQEITKKNKALVHKSIAHYYQLHEKNDLVLEHLEVAEKFEKNPKEKSRINFIIGQLLQAESRTDEAKIRYKKSLKGNPPYEVAFHARLNMSQVTQTSDVKSVKKVRKTFKRMLSDLKNEEYKDKIYYQMAKFDYKQDKIDSTILHLNLSIDYNTTDKIQRAYSYLMLGKIYYEDKQEYKLSKMYYDSTVFTLPKGHNEYEEIFERKEILTEFVKYRSAVDKQDSLQALSKLSPEDLDQYIANFIEQEKARQREVLRKKKEKEKRDKEAKRAEALILAENFGANSSFPFFNPSQLAKSKFEFEEKWGERALEDNWRRSNKESFATFDDVIEDPSPVSKSATIAQPVKEAIVESFIIEVDTAAIPRSIEDLAASNLIIEDGLYNLGKIYYLKLLEEDHSAESFVRLLNEYPAHENTAEVLFIMYKLCQKNTLYNSDDYKERMNNEFPNSLYKKLIDDPNYLQNNKQNNELAREVYATAYTYYKRGEYSKCMTHIEKIKDKYPINDIPDKLSLLETMTYPRSKGLTAYRTSLENFPSQYPTSTLIDYSAQLLRRLDQFLNKSDYSGGASMDSISAILIQQNEIDTYDTTFNQPHYIITLFNNYKVSVNEITAKFELFNSNNFRSNGYKVENIEYDEERNQAKVVGFNNREEAMKYYNLYTETTSFFKNYPNEKVVKFVISKTNYERLIKDKNLISYQKFFRLNYIDTFF